MARPCRATRASGLLQLIRCRWPPSRTPAGVDRRAHSRGEPGPAPALLVRHMERIAVTLPRKRVGVSDLSLMTMHLAVAGHAHLCPVRATRTWRKCREGDDG